MAAITNLRGTVLQIVNGVERRMGYRPSTTVTATRTALTYVDLLNDVLSFVADYGDWPQLYQEITVTAAGSARTIEVSAASPIHHIYEVHYGTQISPLSPRSVSDMRLLDRTSAIGTPRQYAVIDTSGVNPRLRIYPRAKATSGLAMNIGVYTHPRLYVSGDGGQTPVFSQQLLTQGLYAAALLDESNGAETQSYQTQYTMFLRQLREEHNRWQADTGTDLQLNPE